MSRKNFLNVRKAISNSSKAKAKARKIRSKRRLRIEGMEKRELMAGDLGPPQGIIATENFDQELQIAAVVNGQSASEASKTSTSESDHRLLAPVISHAEPTAFTGTEFVDLQETLPSSGTISLEFQADPQRASYLLRHYNHALRGHRIYLYISGSNLDARLGSGRGKVVAEGAADGQWHHIALQYGSSSDLDEAQLYMDGELTSTLPVPTAPLQTTNELKLGAVTTTTPGRTQLHFSGQILNVAIYDQLLTEHQITALANGQPAVDPPAQIDTLPRLDSINYSIASDQIIDFGESNTFKLRTNFSDARYISIRTSNEKVVSADDVKIVELGNGEFQVTVSHSAEEYDVVFVEFVAEEIIFSDVALVVLPDQPITDFSAEDVRIRYVEEIDDDRFIHIRKEYNDRFLSAQLRDGVISADTFFSLVRPVNAVDVASVRSVDGGSITYDWLDQSAISSTQRTAIPPSTRAGVSILIRGAGNALVAVGYCFCVHIPVC